MKGEKRRYLSICSGIEAASVAWAGDPLNWEPAGFAEIEPFPCAVLKHHYPEVPNLGDITAPDFIERAKRLGPVDVVIGGTPCQSFSVAGLRRGLADPRGNLALVFLGIVDALRPRWVVWENVPGVLSSTSGEPESASPDRVGVGPGERVVDEVEYDEGGDFFCFIAALAELRFGWAFRILDAQYFGVPQRRRRVFVVGHSGGWPGAAAVLFESHCLQGHHAPSRKARQGPAADAPASVAIRGRGDGRDIELGEPELANCLLTPNGGRDGMGPGAVLAHTLSTQCGSTTEDGTGRGAPLGPRALPADPEAGCLTPEDPQAFRGHGTQGPAPTLGSGQAARTDSIRVLIPCLFQNHEHAGYRQSETAETLAVSPGRQREANLVGLPDPAYAVAGAGSKFGSGRDAQEAFVVSCAQEPGPVVFDPNQVTSAANRSNPQAGDPCHTLPASETPPVIAFNHQEQQNFRAEAEVTNPLRVGQTEAVCFTQNTRDEVRLLGGDGQIAGTISAERGTKQQNYVAAFKPAMGAKARSIGYGEEIANTLETSAPPAVVQTMQVRRLTPEECEALQGFPRLYTQVPYNKKPAADGPRYKALGNSMAVPVIAWIGQRIEKVEEAKAAL